MKHLTFALLLLLVACSSLNSRPFEHLAADKAPPANLTAPDVSLETTTTSPARVTARRVSRGVTRPRVTTPSPRVVPAGATTDKWWRLALCESGGRNDHGAPYYGFFQFDASTWHSNGGSGLPDEHTYAEQLAVAQLLYSRRGAAPWPVCGPRAGL